MERSVCDDSIRQSSNKLQPLNPSTAEDFLAVLPHTHGHSLCAAIFLMLSCRCVAACTIEMWGLSRRTAASAACPSSLGPFPTSTVVSSSYSSSRIAALQCRDNEWRLCRPNGYRKALSIVSKAVENQKITAKVVDSPGQVKDEEASNNKILPYCSVDRKADKLSLGEMEQEFLEALQSFYYDQKPIMSNEEFDNLKEELIWQGSNVVILSPNEQKFMEASLSYAAGKPNMTDVEYDELKIKLKKAGSKVALEGPRCSIRSKKVYSDCTVDYLKMFLLNVPAALISLSLVFFLDDITGFQITYLLVLPEPYSFVFTWFVLLPLTFLTANSITRVIFKDFIILKGPCPNCGLYNTSFFGTILTVPSGGDVNIVKCEKCGSLLEFNSNTRLITLESTPADKLKEPKPKRAAANGSVD